MNCPDNAYVINRLVDYFNFTSGAELGVRRGEFTSYLLQQNSQLVMSCVDVWAKNNALNEKHDHDSNYELYKANTSPFANRVKEYRMLMSEAAKQHADNSLDFVFIDGTHTYNAVKEDIANWAPKVKTGGLICGHDYNEAFDKGGLVKAVREFCPDIIEFINSSKINVNNEKVIKVLISDIIKGVADRANGCWYIWKS